MLRGFGGVSRVGSVQGGVAVYVANNGDLWDRLLLGSVGEDALDDVGDDHEIASAAAYAETDGLASPDLLCAKVHAVVVADLVGCVCVCVEQLEEGVGAVDGFGCHDGSIDRGNAVAKLARLEGSPIDLAVAELWVLLEVGEGAAGRGPCEPRLCMLVRRDEFLERRLERVRQGLDQIRPVGRGVAGCPSPHNEAQAPGRRLGAVEPDDFSRAAEEPVVGEVGLVLQRSRLGQGRRLGWRGGSDGRHTGRRRGRGRGRGRGSGSRRMQRSSSRNRRLWRRALRRRAGRGRARGELCGRGLGHGLALEREGGLGVGPGGLVVAVGLDGRAHLAGAVDGVAVLVGAEPQQMGEELDGAAEALLGALGVAVQIGVLPVVAAARVVLHRLLLAVGLGLDVFVEDVVLGQLPQDALLPLVRRAAAAHLAQQHAAELLAPVEVLGVVLLELAVVVALAVVVGLVVELLLRGPVAEHAALEVDDMLPVRLACEDGPEAGQGLLCHGARRLRVLLRSTREIWRMSEAPASVGAPRRVASPQHDGGRNFSPTVPGPWTCAIDIPPHLHHVCAPCALPT